jgi:hypothetical protein
MAPPGGVAQLVERYVRNVEVGGSSPLTSTKNRRSERVCAAAAVVCGGSGHILVTRPDAARQPSLNQRTGRGDTERFPVSALALQTRPCAAHPVSIAQQRQVGAAGRSTPRPRSLQRGRQELD